MNSHGWRFSNALVPAVLSSQCRTMASINVFVLVVIIAGLSLPYVQGVGEDIIIDFLEELRNRMCHPIDKLGLPALDPFEIEHAEYAVDGPVLVDFTSSVTNFKLTGLSDFIINDLQISTLPNRISIVNFTLPLTAFKSLYTAKGSLAYILYLAGEGNAEAFVENFQLAVSWYFKTGVQLGIRNMQIEITIGNLHVDFENLFEEPRINDFMHALINELGIELLHDIWEEQGDHVEQLVEDKINNYLGQYTLSEIVGAITGGSEGGSDGPIFGDDDPLPDCKETTKIN